MSDQPAAGGNRQLIIATLAAAVLQVRGQADPEHIAQALRDAEAALTEVQRTRKGGGGKKG